MDDADLAITLDQCGRRLRGALAALETARNERDEARQVVHKIVLYLTDEATQELAKECDLIETWD